MPAGRILRLACLTAFVFHAVLTRAEILESRLRDEASFLRTPPADLTLEFSRIAAVTKHRKFNAVLPPSTLTVWQHSAKVDLDELTTLFASDGNTEPETTDAEVKTIIAYGQLRNAMADFAESAPWRSTVPPPTGDAPDDLPEEFALYVNGVLAHQRGDAGRARDDWLRLLQLPAAQRKHRSIWAAFLLGRCPPEAVGNDWSIGWFERCREMAAAGDFTDSLGLAAASYGWEAKLHLDRGELTAAIDLYLAQLACGDVRAADSLAHVASLALTQDPKDPAAVSFEAPAVNAVLAAFAGARGGPHRAAPEAAAVRAWLTTVSPADPSLRPFAPRFAWAAYGAGDDRAANAWLDAYDGVDGLAHWIRAKINVRAGKIDDAGNEILTAFRCFDAAKVRMWDTHSALEQPDRDLTFSPVDQCRAELAVIRLAQRRYPEALRLFFRSDPGESAYYVCERVLTVDEFKGIVDRADPAAFDAERYRVMRSILAARLARANRWDEARPYFEPQLQEPLDRYRDALRRAEDPDAYDEDRAAALWLAARATERYGEGFFGRASRNGGWRRDANWTRLGRSADEASRAATAEREMKPSTPVDIAGTLAWRAAELLPDEDDQTAMILNTAGRWYTVSDNDRADRFYKALVRRCGTTKLGRVADRRGWFAP